MAHSGIGRILAAKGGYPVQGCGSLHGNVGYLDRERALSAGPKVRKKEEDKQKGTSPKAIIVEQWICFVLGFACMADLGDLHEARTVCSFCKHCMVGIALCAGVAGDSSRVPRHGCGANTPGVDASLTGLSFQPTEDPYDLLVGAGMYFPLAGQFVFTRKWLRSQNERRPGR
jgi:hypothetical protein